MTAGGPRGQRERGIALVAVLWALALLAAVLIGFSGTTRTETVLTRNLLEQARARHLADGAIQLAILRLLDPRAESKVRIDGAPFAVNADGIEIAVSILDEGGKIDLNVASPDLLAGLFASAGVPPREARLLARNVVDWRDEAIMPGAQQVYAALGEPFAPRNRPFDALAELHHIFGMTPALARRITPYLTLFNQREGIDPAVAPAAVLAALPGFDPRQVDIFLRTRPPAYFREDSPELDLGVARSFVQPSSGTAFTIAAEVAMAGGATYRREAVVLLTGRPSEPFLIAAVR